MEFGHPLGDRKSNDSIVNLPKSNDFGPPYRCRLRIWPPTEKYHVKTLKKSMTKKGHQKFWEINEHFLGGNAEIFSRTPKKCRSKISAKIWPPVLKFWIR